MADICLRVIHLVKTGPEGPILDCAKIVIVHYGRFTYCMHFSY